MVDEDTIRRALEARRITQSAQARTNALQEQNAARARRYDMIQQGVNTLLMTPQILGVIEQDELKHLDALERQRMVQEAGGRAPDLAPFLADPNYYARTEDDLTPLSLIGERAALMDRQAARRQGISVDEYRARVRAGEVSFGGLTPEQLRRQGTVQNLRRPVLTPWTFVTSIFQNTGSVVDTAMAGLQQSLMDQLGSLTGETQLQRQFRERRARSAQFGRELDMAMATPVIESTTLRGFHNALVSTASLLPALAATAITRNPVPILSWAGTQTYGESYSRYRAQGAGIGEATAGAGGNAVVEVLTELLPAKYLARGFGRTPLTQFATRYLARDVLGEQFATLYQDATDVAMTGSGQTWDDYIASRGTRAYETLVSTVTQTALMAGGSRLVQRVMRQRDDEVSLGNVDAVLDAASQSKVRAENPELFREIIAKMLNGKEDETVFVAPEKVRELFQSDAELRQDAFWGSRADAIREAELAGEDVAIPLADVATDLAGTSRWDRLKSEVRTAPDGFSRTEIDQANEEIEDAMRQAAEDAVGQFEADRAAQAPVIRVYEEMREKLVLSGHRPDAASHLATLFAQRQRTRAARIGREMTGQEAAAVEVRRVLPERLAQIVAVDLPDAGLRSVITEMRKARGVRSERARFGASLIDFIRARGGVEDPGGDIAAMGAGRVGRGFAKKGQAKIIAEGGDARQGAFAAGGRGSSRSPDAVAMAAWEAGYFPEFGEERPAVNDLLAAISEELRGRHRYATDNSSDDDLVREAAQELRALLDQAGMDPDKATPLDIQRVVERYQSEVAEGRAYGQSYDEGARGRVTFTTDGRSVIDLFESRDLSTFIHESGHVFLEELRFDASLPEAPQQLRDDWQAVQDWFAENGFPLEQNGNIPTEAHELWARGFERFAMEGKAPSTILRRAFDAFRSWLLTIYQVVENLRSPISPEIRDVMTRLLVTEQEIATAAEEQATAPLFESAEAAGMTEEEFATYQGAASQARDEAHDALLYRTMRSVRAARTKEWKEQEVNVRSEVADEVDAQPVFRALRILRSGQRLDKGFLTDAYGADALDAMPRSRTLIYSDTNAVHPDVLAEEAGFESGDAMIRTLMAHEETRKRLREGGDKRSVRETLIDQGTADVMADRFGDVLRDGSIEEEALAAVHNEKQGDLIEAELRALHRQRFGENDPRAGRVTPYQVAKRWAEERVRRSPVSEVASGAAIQMHERAARKASKAAESAIAQRDLDEAYRHKQRQMLANAMVHEARKAKDGVDASVARLGKVAGRRTMKSVDQDYLEQAHELLERYDFTTRSLRDVEKQVAFEEWAAAQEEAGFDVLVPPRYQDKLGRRHWSKLSVEEIAGLDDTVKQMLHLGRHKQKLLDGAEQRTFGEGQAEMIASADGSGGGRRISDLNDPTRALPERIKSWIRSADAAMIKVEQLVDWLDGNNPNGPWNRLLFKPMADAQGAESDMLRKFTESMQALISTMPRAQAKDWNRLVDTPELIDKVSADESAHGRPFRFGKDQIVMIAANWGNAGNRQRLVDGYGWREADVQAVLDRLMTQNDWKFVQSVWDAIDEFRPALFALERRVNGVEPEAVQAVDVVTPYGTFRGGYFPAVYDPQYSTAAAAQEEQKQLKGGFFRASTRASASKERAAAVKRPLMLHTSVITAHVREVIHDITHREAVIQARKLLADGKIRNAIERAMGPEYVRAAEAWVEDIADPGVADRKTDRWIRGVGRHLHKGITMAGLGYRVSTVLVQPLGLSNMAGIVGERAVAEGTARFWRNPRSAYREVTEKSAEMRDRFNTMDATIADLYGQRAANSLQRFGPTVFEKGAFMGILYADMSITVGGWIGAYNKALREGMSEGEAIYSADKVIRTSQGAGGAKDKSSILRQNHIIRSLYPFFSYLNALYNQQRDIGRRAQQGDVLEAMRRGWWIAIVPAVAHALLFGPGPDDDDEEGWANYLARMTLVAQTSSIPGVGQLANSMNSGWGYRVSSLQKIGEGISRGAGDIKDVATGEEPSRSWILNMFETIGILTAKPLAAPGRAIEFGVDWAAGDTEPQNAVEVAQGLTEGRLKREMEEAR